MENTKIYALYNSKDHWIMTCGSLEKANDWHKVTEDSTIKEMSQEKSDSIKETLKAFTNCTLPNWACFT